MTDQEPSNYFGAHGQTKLIPQSAEWMLSAENQSEVQRASKHTSQFATETTSFQIEVRAWPTVGYFITVGVSPEGGGSLCHVECSQTHGLDHLHNWRNGTGIAKISALV